MSSTPAILVPLAIWPVALAIVVVSAIVITLVITLIGRRGRAVASVFLAVGLLVFFLLAAGIFFVRMDTRTRSVNVDRQLAQFELAPARGLAGQRAIELGDTPSPPKPATDEETPKAESPKPAGNVDNPKAESPKPATDASSAPAETSAAEKAKSEQPPPADNRPDWVGTEPAKVDGVYRVPVTVGPWPTSEESMKALPAAVDAEIAKYAVSKFGNQAAGKLKLDFDYVISHMIQKDIWEEPLKIDSFDDVKHMVGRDIWENSANAADGEWTQLHALVKFDGEVKRRLDDDWARLLRVERLFSVGVLGAIVMIILTAVYSYLKIDLRTGGAYRGRLRAGALAAILAVIVAVLLTHA